MIYITNFGRLNFWLDWAGATGGGAGGCSSLMRFCRKRQAGCSSSISLAAGLTQNGKNFINGIV